MKAYDWKYTQRLSITLLISFLIYYILLQIFQLPHFKVLHLPKTNNKPIEVQIIPPTKPKQIVDVPPVNIKPLRRAKPKYLSNKAQQVPENMVSPINGPPLNKNPSTQPQKSISQKPNSTKGFAIKSLLPPLIASNISTQDNIIKEKVGPFTLISTAPSPLASFVITEGRRVLRVLQENISNYTWYYEDIADFKHNAEVIVDFSPYGTIMSTKLVHSSGSKKVDWVFLKSVSGGVIELQPPTKAKTSLIFSLGKNYLKISVANE